MLPLLLGLGLLAGNHLFAQYKKRADEEELAGKYRGLLGSAPGPMGPPTEAGQMGYQGGSGLLADPTNMQRQLQFAAGVAGMPGQQEKGVNLLNAAMQRAQQQGQYDIGNKQWQQSFDAGRADAAAVDTRFQQSQGQSAQQFAQTFQAGRDDAGAAWERFNKQYALQQAEAARQAKQWEADFGLRKQVANAKDDGMPKLQAGYMWTRGPDGGLTSMPIPGSEDYRKADQGLQGLNQMDTRIGQYLDLVQGKETDTRGGKRVRMGGSGTELPYGEGAARLSILRGQIISDVAKLRDMGVLQQGEMENIDQQLPDATGWTSPFKRNDTIGAAYQELRDQVRAKRKGHLQVNPWLMPPAPKGATIQ